MKADYIDKISWELRVVIYHSDSAPICHALPPAGSISLLILLHRWKQVKTVKKRILSFLWLLLSQSAVKIGAETRLQVLRHSAHSVSLCLSVCPSVAMQFGQLLTHLDTTQQMINNTLKDNNTLLAQVGSPASRRKRRCFHSQMTVQWR